MREIHKCGCERTDGAYTAHRTQLHKCACVRFSKKTGKIDTTLTGLGNAMLKLWALQNTTKTKACVVLDLEERKTIFETIGTADSFPKVHDKEEDFEFEFPDELYDELLKGFKDWHD